MSNSLPLSGTSVSVDKSIGEIKDALRKAGFSKIGDIESGDGEHTIFADLNGIGFKWSINRKAVIDSLIHAQPKIVQNWISWRNQRGIKKLKEIQESADRVGWRILNDQIRATCILIRYGISNIADAFAGSILVGDKGQTMGQILAPAMLEGNLNTPDIFKTLLIEDKNEDKAFR